MHYLTPSATHKGKDAGSMQYEKFYPHFILPILRLIPETLKQPNSKTWQKTQQSYSNYKKIVLGTRGSICP